MSSLRNSLHRRNHKERGQLAHRSKLGILEKHKDYVLRAKDYHSKQDRLTRLKQKAADRNKDEFYFSMHRQRTEGGVHVQDRGNKALPADIVKVLKTQDENYIRTMRLTGMKKMDRIKVQLSTIADLLGASSLDGDEDAAMNDLDDEELDILQKAGVIAGPSSSTKRTRKTRPPPKHIVFADTDEQAQVLATSSSSRGSRDTAPISVLEAGPSDLGWKSDDATKRGKKKNSRVSDSGHDAAGELAEQQEEARVHRSRLLKELSARLHRDEQLRYAEREMEMQKLLMGKGGSRKMAGVEEVKDDKDDEDEDMDEDARPRRSANEKTWKPRVYKWRLERKR